MSKQKLKPGSQASAPITAPAMTVRTVTEDDTAASETLAAGPGPLAVIGPSDALPAPVLPAVDPVAAAAARLAGDRSGAAAELSALARRISEGEELATKDHDRIAQLIERARWTMGQWKAEIVAQKRRAELRVSMADLNDATAQAASAQQALDDAIAARTKAVAELDAVVAAARNTLVTAEARIRAGQFARKALMDSAPAVVKDKYTKAKRSADEMAATIRGLEQKANAQLARVNAATAREADTIADTDAGAEARITLATAQEALDTARAELNDARQRLKEIEADAAELLHLCEVA